MRVPVLARMAAKRRIGYQSIGYKIVVRAICFPARWSHRAHSLRDSQATKSLEERGRNCEEAAKPDNFF